MNDNDKLLTLARRTLWISFVWNDHNFDDNIRKYALETCKELDIKSFEDAQKFLARMMLQC